jgi:hypothetical protein
MRVIIQVVAIRAPIICAYFLTGDRTTMPTNLTIPPEWLKALRRLAKRRGVSLSRLLCEAAAALLPREERNRLPELKERGRPSKAD